MWIVEYHRDQFCDLWYFCCILMISSMQLDLIMSNYLLMTPFFSRMIEMFMPQKKKQVIYLKKIPAGVLPTNYRLTARRQIFCSFIQRISRFRNTCIQTTFITIKRVKFVQYLGLMIDENLYWQMHAEYVYNSLVKYFGIFNRVKTIISKKIARQLYFAFIHSRIKYGIEVFGDCANEYLQKLQVIQNKLLKLLLNFDRRMSTNELHQQLSLLKVVDIHTVNVLPFVNECRSGRCPTLFSSYYHVREAGYELRHNDRLHVVNPHLYKKKLQIDYHETLYWNLSLNLLHLITVCVHALLLSWYHTYLLHVVS